MVKPQLEEGSTATDYEPYTGGQASPNPDYPSEVKSVGDNVNLLPNNGTSKTVNGVDFTVNSDGSVKAIGTKESGTVDIRIASNLKYKAGTYTLKDGHIFVITDENKGWWDSGTTKIFENDFTISDAYVNVEGVVGTTVDKTFYPKLEKGTVATPYSPYGQGCVNVVVENKNLLNILNTNCHLLINTYGTTIKDTNYNSLIVDTRNKDSIYVSGDFSLLNSGVLRVGLYDKYPLAGITGTRINKNSNGSIDTTNVNYVLLAFYADGQPFNDIQNSFQVEYGTTGTTRVDHQEQSFTIPTQQPFRKIGDYADTFEKIDGKWYEKHYIGEIVLDGTEDWANLTNLNNGNYQTRTSVENKTSNKKGFCDKFTIDETWGIDESIILRSKNMIYLNINGERLSEISASGVKKWFSNNNTKVDCILAEPIYIECTSVQTEILEELSNKATSYKEETNIYSTDEVSPIFEVEAYADINSKFEELSNAIVSLGGVI